MASSSTSDFLYDAYMKWILLSDRSWNPESELFFALFTTVPNLDGTNSNGEVATGATGYQRISVPCNSTYWEGSTSGNREFSIKKELVFPEPQADWGTITGAGLYDSIDSTGTNNLYWVAYMSSPKTVNRDDSAPRILQNTFKIGRAYC